MKKLLLALGLLWVLVGCAVEDIRIVLERSYDYIIIAIMSKKTVRNIKRSLLDMAVETERLVWLDSRLVDEDEE